MIGKFERKTGGPAYPSKFVAFESMEISNNVDIYQESSGMTLRDAFAMSAMGKSAIHIYEEYGQSSERTAKGIVEVAYEIADAMLAERAK